MRSRRANDLLGTILGLLVWMPYRCWQHEHAVHHATAGNLDRRGIGDITTLTVAEYNALFPPGAGSATGSFATPPSCSGSGGSS
jgi:omega-6 fatty acid desaturase (delta-12 desaturase)